MTASKENIIKLLFELSVETEFVSNKVLAKALEISPPSVSEMLLKLHKEGYIEHIPYRGCRLSDLGKHEAIKLLRYHRLWELFLIQQFGYSWSEAHQEAHELEHATSPRLADCLERQLNYPKTCPHGDIEPASNQIYLRTLNDVALGERCEILYFADEPELLDYMQSLGLQVGMAVELIKRAPYEGALLFKNAQGEVQMSHKAATRIAVK